MSASVISALQAMGADVVRVSDILPRGTLDESVLARAVLEEAVVVTEDKDFGQLVHERGLRAVGVGLYRLPGMTSAAQGAAVVRALREVDPAGKFVVVTEHNVRVRTLAR